MPARSRPTARILTPAGWASLAVVVLLGLALSYAVFVAPRPPAASQPDPSAHR